MCAAANPTLTASRPSRTCWPTSCWGSSSGWSLPPPASATSLSSACAHISDRRTNSTPCASSPSAVSHIAFKGEGVLFVDYQFPDLYIVYYYIGSGIMPDTAKEVEMTNYPKYISFPVSEVNRPPNSVGNVKLVSNVLISVVQPHWFHITHTVRHPHE